MHEPKPDDAVLGNQSPNTPYNALVLGGIKGAKQRLNSPTLAVKLEALVTALEYDEEGLKLVHEFITQETEACTKWIYTNWVWLKAPQRARIELANYITCLKHINKELMELVLATMITDSSGSKVAPPKKILEQIDELRSQQVSHKNSGAGYQAHISMVNELISKKAISTHLAVGYRELGDLYCAQIGQEELPRENLKIAIIAYQEAITYDKDSSHVPAMLNKRGLAYYYLGNYQATIEDTNQAIKLNPNFAWAYNTRGLAYYELGDYQAAIENYNQAIKINPYYAIAYSNRGLAYYKLRDYQTAILDYNQALKLNPNFVNAYENRGNAYYDLGNKQAAIENYNQAIRTNPNCSSPYEHRGYTYHRLGDNQAAIEDYNQALKLNPNSVWAYDSRGYAYYLLGNYQAAIEDYNQALELNPNYQWSYNNRGLAYYYLGNYEAAIQNYNQAIKINSNFAWPYHNRGNVYSALKDKKAAIKDYEQAANLYKQQGKDSQHKDMLNRIFKLKNERRN